MITYVAVFWTGDKPTDEMSSSFVEQELRKLSREHGWKMAKTSGWTCTDASP